MSFGSQNRSSNDHRSITIEFGRHGKNAELFNFTRCLQAYRDSFNSGKDMLALDPNDSFFSYLKNPDGKAQ